MDFSSEVSRSLSGCQVSIQTFTLLSLTTCNKLDHTEKNILSNAITQGLRGLRSRALFYRDETRRDWRAILELALLGQDCFFQVPLVGKSGK